MIFYDLNVKFFVLVIFFLSFYFICHDWQSSSFQMFANIVCNKTNLCQPQNWNIIYVCMKKLYMICKYNLKLSWAWTVPGSPIKSEGTGEIGLCWELCQKRASEPSWAGEGVPEEEEVIGQGRGVPSTKPACGKCRGIWGSNHFKEAITLHSWPGSHFGVQAGLKLMASPLPLPLPPEYQTKSMSLHAQFVS